MQGPRFSPRISFIEMAPRLAPAAAALAALPCLSSQTDRHHREQAMIGRIFQALLTQTDTVVLIYRIDSAQRVCYALFGYWQCPACFLHLVWFL